MGIFAAEPAGCSRWRDLPDDKPHGFISGALFFWGVGVIYDRMHTRRNRGPMAVLVNRMPVYAAVFLLFTMANVGLPGTSGFVGEFLTFMAVFQVNNLGRLLLSQAVVILSAAYALWLYRRVVMGELIKASLKGISEHGPPRKGNDGALWWRPR